MAKEMKSKRVIFLQPQRNSQREIFTVANTHCWGQIIINVEVRSILGIFQEFRGIFLETPGISQLCGSLSNSIKHAFFYTISRIHSN